MLFLRWKRDTNAPPWILIGFAAATLSIGIFRPGTDTIGYNVRRKPSGGGHNHPVTVIAPSYQRSLTVNQFTSITSSLCLVILYDMNLAGTIKFIIMRNDSKV